ncbi:MAG: serine hydrolase [Cytophagales bacterium]|nr:serine hydrolase [Bernardetiaceae bacterium]MDW8205557.1 serine hydrolase [Cytophagales bacterium]
MALAWHQTVFAQVLRTRADSLEYFIWQAAWEQRQATERTLTLLQNKNNLLPFKELDNFRFAAVSISDGPMLPDFGNTLQLYAPVKLFSARRNLTRQIADDLLTKMQPYNVVIISLHGKPDLLQQMRTIESEVAYLINQLDRRTKIVLAVFGSPIQLLQIDRLDRIEAVALTYDDTQDAQELMAQAIFGAIGFQGKLPFHLPPLFEKDAGIMTQPLGRMKFTWAEELGLTRLQLRPADSIARMAIEKQAAPGCVVLAAKDGKVFYYKAFGFQTYDSLLPVQKNQVFDLASITKISTSIAALMKLYDDKKIDIDKPLARYEKSWAKTNKKSLTLKEILTHHAGLKAWIPFWQNARQADGALRPDVFSKDSTRVYSLKVADKLYINHHYLDSIFQQIRNSPLGKRGEYVYSDLSYYYYPRIVRRLAGKNFDDFLDENFYAPLGASTLTFNPLNKGIPLRNIVPTELDTAFRKQLLHGTVHDEGAAMMGGISGHAGLFGNAADLAKLMQMYLNGGLYAGKQYLKPETIAYFTRCHSCNGKDPAKTNPRGIGFDKPRSNNTAPSASAESFGHSGFTGTFTWADPANGLLYIFLSNRVYPTRQNNRLSELSIRSNMLESFYQLFKRN